MSNNVSHPKHYTQGGIECIDALKAATIGKTGIEAVCVANVIKYLWRYEEKNGLEDVFKAQWYVNRLIQELQEKNQSYDEQDYPFFNSNRDTGCCLDCAHIDHVVKDAQGKVISVPCKDCKNNAIVGTEEYNNRHLLFQWPKEKEENNT